MEKTAIITLTLNPCLDISAEVADLVPDKKMRCSNVMIDPGGGGINVSRVIDLLGGTSTAVFPVGGSIGRNIGAKLRNQGVNSVTPFMEGNSRQNFAVRVRESGKQFRFGLPGPHMTEQEWSECLHTVVELSRQAEFLVASGSLPPGVPSDFYGRLMQQCHPVKIILDTSGEALKEALRQEVFLLKPNRRELEELCSCSLDQEETQNKVCRDLVASGLCQVLVLSLGAQGALMTTRQDQVRLPAIQVETVSSIGAGDSFVGAFVLALHEKLSLRQAFVRGMAAGTAALLSEGTRLCRREDVERLSRQYQDMEWNHG